MYLLLPLQNGLQDKYMAAHELAIDAGNSEKNESGFAVNEWNGWVLFVIISIIYMIFDFISQQYIFSDELYYRSFSEQLGQQNLQAFLDAQSQYWWLSYLLTPLMIALKASFAAVCISIGAVLASVDLKFNRVFKMALVGEVVFICAQIIFLYSLLQNLDTLTVESIAGYYPLSALSLIGIENINAEWAVYPLQIINVFEVMYIGLIAWLLSKQWKPSFVDSLNIVIPSYGLGLLLWLVLVAFLTFQVS
ncbi:hypothetical protein [Gracilimonas mengyeensis]|uniref:Yip1 domain-containing protein n=1 Tax=Gracilimonas mengyeensis TaxID=1302730 RepID=A0A521DBZ5_9BACT|nr:hypothetical protein [Gracilimonas mengyeensis]SMO69203.1 hypothetical protein SAMN06265219_10817 [Gracilimonas mengyeensis]